MSEKRPRTRTSPIWLLPLEEFQKIVKESKTITEILRKCGIQNKGNNGKTLKQRLKEENIDYSHIMLGRGATFRRGFVFTPKGMSLEECFLSVFIKRDFFIGKGSVRRYIRRFKLLEEKCRDCPLTNTWNGKPLTLQLEHVNGDSTDDRLENLCWLCPNCHSQTDTYTGKANRKKPECKQAT